MARRRKRKRRSRDPRRASLALSSVVALTIALVLAAGALRAQPSESDRPVLLREVHVPVEAFEALRRRNPDGVLMDLETYRELVLAALAESLRTDRVELPPQDTVVSAARYTGRVHGSAVRFGVELTVLVTRTGWALCELGGIFDALGAVHVDGEPGWVIVDGARAPQAQSAQAAKKAETDRRSYLLLDGEGEHTVELALTMPLREENERLVLGGPLIGASSALLELVVPGEAEGEATGGALRAIPTEQNGVSATRFHLALGSSKSFRLAWRGRRSSAEVSPLLLVDHRLTVSPRTDAAGFNWTASVTVARRPLSEIVLQPPAGFTVTGIEGPLVHDWQVTPAGVRVGLKEPVRGEVELTLRGLAATAQDGSFRITAPEVAGAFSNRGHLALVSTDAEDLQVTAVDGLRELALDALAMPPAPSPVVPGARLARLFEFSARGASVSGSWRVSETLLENRAAFVLRLGETGLDLRGRYQIAAREGVDYELDWTVPPPWRLVSLEERPTDRQAANRQPASGLRFETEATPAGTLVHLRWRRGVHPGEPLEFEAVFEHATIAEDRDWDERTLDLTLPVLPGARRTDLAVLVSSSIDLLTSDLPGWHALPSSEARSLGLLPPEEQIARAQRNDRLSASLTTSEPQPTLSLSVGHRPPRGEYRAVTHLLAAENRVRVRCDVQLAIVDRAVDEVVLRIPALPAETAVVILADDLKEREQDFAGGIHRVRFARPWIGTKQLRLEYERPAAAELALPDIRLEGDFAGERFVVLQSRGPVELSVERGPALVAIEVDDVPDFASAWSECRILDAFRIREGEVGTVGTVRHAGAPVLPHLARYLRIRTVLGADGSDRSECEVLLAYSDLQSLRLRLPQGARLLAAEVNGEPIRDVLTDEGPDPHVAIPLPPRSYSMVRFVYERLAVEASADGRRPVRGERLGSWGHWIADGPELLDVPVGSTTWSVYHPEGYRFEVAGGNLRPRDATRATSSFFASFLAPLAQGKRPRLQSFSAIEEGRPVVTVPEDETDTLESRAREDNESSAPRLAPAVPEGEASGVHALEEKLLAHGRQIELSKIGGSPHVVLSYLELEWTRAARRAVFWVALVITFLLGIRCARLRFWLSAGLLLVVAVLLPLALGWDSPLLLVPLCEALCVALVLLLAFDGVRLALKRLAPAFSRLPFRKRERYPQGLLVLIGLALLAAPSVGPAQEQQPAKPKPLVPYDTAIIPRPSTDEGKRLRAFVPRNRFRELWELAHPESKVPGEPPGPYVLGSTTYRLRLEGSDTEGNDTYVITGTIPVRIDRDAWVTIKLPFDRAQLRAARLDGRAIGVSQDEHGAFIEVRGPGRRRLEVELVGAIEQQEGSFQLSSRILKGPSATVEAELPAGAVVRSGGARRVVVESLPESTRAVLDLGLDPSFALSWSFPQVEGDVGARLQSVSYTALGVTVDGYDVGRRERVEIVGPELERLSFDVVGQWEVTEVVGRDLLEWTLVESDGGRELVVYLSRPVRAVELGVYGHAVVPDQAPVAALALKGAVKQESYFGLHHGRLRRFGPSSLEQGDDLKRTVYSIPARLFGLPEGQIPDRVYRGFASGADQRVVLEDVESEVSSTTSAIALIGIDRPRVFVRTRFGAAEMAPLTHRVELPGGWEVRGVRSETLRDWTIETTGGRRFLVVRFASRPGDGTEVTWSAELPPLATGASLALPFLRRVDDPAIARRSEMLVWTLAADDSLEIDTSRVDRWERIEATAEHMWVKIPSGSSYRPLLSVRSRRADSPFTVTISPSPRLLHATCVTFARLAEAHLLVNARYIVEMRKGGAEVFRFRLPPGAELVSLETRNQRSRNVSDAPTGSVVEVRLQSPSTTVHAFDLVYRRARADDEDARVQPTALLDANDRLVNVDHFVGVVHTARTYTLELDPTQLAELEAERLPFLPAGVSPRSLRSAFLATSADWSLGVAEERVELATGTTAVVLMADLTTLVGNDGTRRTRAVYTLRNEGLQFFVVMLPPDASLWAVTLNGRAVSVGGGPAAAGDTSTTDSPFVLRIPLENAGRSQLPVDIAVDYEESPLDLPSLRSSYELTAPSIPPEQGVRVQATLWSVQFPGGYSVDLTGGNMRPVFTSEKHAERVKQLLEEKTAVLELTRTARSRRERSRAERDLARLEQALSDSLAELEITRGQTWQERRAIELGQEEVRRRQSEDERLVGAAQAEQQALRQVRQKQAQSPPVNRDLESFHDQTLFLEGHRWRGGERAAQQVPREDAPPETQERGIEPRALLENEAFEGWSRSGVPLGTDGVLESSPRSPAEESGLPPLKGSLRDESVPALDVVEAQPDALTYTFRHPGPDAAIELTVTREEAVPRTAAWVALVVLAAGAALELRRRRKHGARKGRFW